MGVHDVGYRSWDARKTLRVTRPIAIARSGVSLVLRAKWIRILLLGGWLPILLPAAVVLVFEYGSQQDPSSVAGVLGSPVV
ncbi:MAG: hypothetical protein AAF989_10870, partial [Planctomycetota bacterium]